MPWFSSTFFGITRITTLTCQRSQVGVLSRPSPECSSTSASTPNLTSTRAGVLAWAPAHRGSTIVHSQEEFHDSIGNCLSGIVVSCLRMGKWQQAVCVRPTEYEAEEANAEEHRGHVAA